MVVTITYIKLRSIWKFFSLSMHGYRIVLQTRTQPGFISFKNSGFGYEHFTATAWESEDAMKKFARSGAHLESMKASKKLGKEIRTYTFEADQVPNWKEAKRLLKEKGKVLNF